VQEKLVFIRDWPCCLEKVNQKIFSQMVGLDVDESHGIPIRKKITKTKHKSKWYEGILDTLVAPFIPPSHSQQSVCHRQKTPAKIKKK